MSDDKNVNQGTAPENQETEGQNKQEIDSKTSKNTETKNEDASPHNRVSDIPDNNLKDDKILIDKKDLEAERGTISALEKKINALELENKRAKEREIVREKIDEAELDPEVKELLRKSPFELTPDNLDKAIEYSQTLWLKGKEDKKREQTEMIANRPSATAMKNKVELISTANSIEDLEAAFKQN